ncbi:MAG TPA: hypothetical protein DCY26_05510 [Hyphomonas sp.]|nr:hypothetical protein [Hyphomonas sp.]
MFKRSTINCAAIATLGLAFPFSASFAQTEPAADKADKLETVVVTGSRIVRPNLTSSTPVVSVTAETLANVGMENFADIATQLPQFSPAFGASRTQSTFSGVAASGLNTANLRNLGTGRSLVLINGRRVPGGTSTDMSVDFNSIPTSNIERIEIITGGASAVYGSDAIAGVVNFILKDDYEGAQITVGGGGGFDGNAQYETADFLFGGNFDNGRGNLVTYASYFNRDGVKQSQYDYSRVSASVVYGYDLVNGGYALGAGRVVDTLDEYLAARQNILTNFPGYSVFVFNGGSATPPWGQISNNAANPFQNLSTNPATAGQFAAANTDCNPATPGVAVNGGNLSFNDQGQLTPYFGGNSTTGSCGMPLRAAGSSRYNYAPDNFIYLPAERWGIQTFGNYDITDSIRMKTFLSYVRSAAQVQLAATPITGLSIPVSSPAIAGADGIVGTADDPHPDLSAALNSRPNPAANFTYAWRSNGIGPREGEFVNSQLLGRVTFTGDITENWEWNLTAGWGQGRFNQTLKNNINRVALLQGVMGCANVPAAARLPNCVNVDIFGPPALTPSAAAASFMRTDVQANQMIEQTAFSGYVRGDLFTLPAGPVSTVVGFEYRDDKVNLQVDDAQRRGEIAGFNAVQNIVGSLDVYEAYTEVSVPLLADLPLVKELGIEAGYRVSDYSTIGSVDSYKYGARYSPVDWLRFRAVYNKAVRAPSALESFQAGDQGFPSYQDPCRNTVTSANPALLAFCTTNGNIGAGFVPIANAPTFVAANAQVQAFAFGNPNLDPETGETFTAGVVFEPDFLPWGQFRMTADYFDIELSDAIVSRGAQTILNSCYNNLGGTAQSAADCQQIVRDPATGQITSVNTSLTNSIATTEIQGWDIQADYQLDLDEVLKGAPGSLGVNLLLTLTDKWEAGGVDFLGVTFGGIGGATPEYKTVTTVDYQLDDWLFQVRHNYVPSMEQAYFGGPDTDAFSNFDASVAWDVNDRVRIVGGVNNVFDEFPPQTVTGVLDQGNTDAALYAPWVIGRTFSIQARVKF